MAITIGSNIASLSAQRQLNAATDQLSHVAEHLSSGLRITRPSDDAAGLAIAADLNSAVQVYTQGVRNLNDGISYLNIADGSMQSLTNILIRLRELATQSSNGTYTDAQRGSLDKEAQALFLEYNRTLQTTSFDENNVFSTTPLTLQAGYGDQESITTSSIGRSSAGTISFGAESNYSSGAGPQEITTGDLNSDGKVDVAVTDYSAGTVSIALGNGDGTFLAPRSLNIPQGATSAYLADMNGDGKQDLIVGEQTGLIAIFTGNGDGTFRAGQSYSAPGNISALQVADVNGDGIADIVSAGQNTDVINVLLGNRDGSFRAPVNYAAGTAVGSPTDLKLVDVNHDGILDVVSTGFGDNTVDVLLGNGDGTFKAPNSFVVGLGAGSVQVADINGDGNVDAIVANSVDGTVSILVGNGDGTFKTQQTIATAVGEGAIPGSEILQVADLNGDGTLDILTTDFVNSKIGVLLGCGDGTFAAAQTFSDTSAYSLATADLNGDGTTDIFDGSLFTFGVLLGTGSSSPTGLHQLNGISLATRSAALAAQTEIDSQLANVSSTAAIIGASMSRVQTAVSVLQTRIEGYTEAESRINDVDVAEASSIYAATKIRQQAAAGVLAQANSQPALALTLFHSLT